MKHIFLGILALFIFAGCSTVSSVSNDIEKKFDSGVDKSAK